MYRKNTERYDHRRFSFLKKIRKHEDRKSTKSTSFFFSEKKRKKKKKRFSSKGLSCRYLGRILREWRDDPEIQDGRVRRE